jgi:hypothetical protein
MILVLLLLCCCSLFLAIGGYFAYKRGLLAQFGFKPKDMTGVAGLKSSSAAVKASSAEVDAATSAMDKEAKDAGLDPEIIKGLASSFGGVTLGSEGGCMFKPVNGVCKPGFTLVDGCCELNETDPLKRSDIMKSIAKDVGTELLVSGIAKKLAKTVGSKFAGKLGSKVGSKLLSRAVGKLAGKLGTKMAAKGAIMGAKMAKNASMGPVGAAMMVFDIVSMALDFADVGGYATFTANSVNTRTRNGIEYQLENIAKASNMDYPMLFPVGDAFPKEYEAVSNKISAHFMNDILEDISKKDPTAIENLIAATVKAEETGEDFEIPESFIELFGQSYDDVTKKKHRERDQFIYDEMQKVLPDNLKDHIENFTHMSTPNRMGVSLSKKGADAWNAKHRNEFFDKFDAIKPKELPEDYQQPMYAMYTQNYRVVDKSNPGKADNPNMVSRRLSKPATIGGYYGMLLAYCEKPRKTSGKTINMFDYGVRLDPNTGTCRFTPQYCKKMGMKYDGGGDTNCKNYPGQKVAEMIFGTTVTRGAIKTANDAKKNIKKNLSDLTSGNPKKMAKGAAKMLLDPFGINQKIGKAGLKAGKSVAKGAIKSVKQNFKDFTSGNPKRMAKAAVKQLLDPFGIKKKIIKKVVPKKVTKAVNKAAKSVGKFFCFSPETRVRLKCGELVFMKDLKLGDVLVGDIIVDATMQIRNESDPYYKIYSKELNEYIYVTGRHYIKHGETYVHVKDFPTAEPTDKVDGILNCLVTSNNNIPVGEYTFWDWEDNLVPNP